MLSIVARIKIVSIVFIDVRVNVVVRSAFNALDKTGTKQNWERKEYN